MYISYTYLVITNLTRVKKMVKDVKHFLYKELYICLLRLGYLRQKNNNTVGF